jgi:hypothetical protein
MVLSSSAPKNTAWLYPNMAYHPAVIVKDFEIFELAVCKRVHAEPPLSAHDLTNSH